MTMRTFSLGGLFLGLLLGTAAWASEWSTRDVEAAERYRENEQSRAERYRAEVTRDARGRASRRPAAKVAAAPARRTAAERGEERREERGSGTPVWWRRAVSAAIEPFDEEAIAGWWSEAEAFAQWWSEKVAPRWQAWADAQNGHPEFHPHELHSEQEETFLEPLLDFEIPALRVEHLEDAEVLAHDWWAEERARLERARGH